MPDTTQPWVRSNKHDYIPGEMVIMFGGRFQAGEQIRLTLVETPNVHEDREFTVTADGVGNYWFDAFRPEEHDIGVSFVLTAEGLTSGYQAQTTFTDAIVPGVHTTGNNGDPAASELTLQKPLSVVPGTFMLAQVTIEGYSTSHIICTPSGWTTQMGATILRTNNSSSVAQQVFWKVAGAGEPISYTWQFREDVASCGSTNKQITGKGSVGGIIPYTGVNAGHASGPISHFQGATGSSTTVDAPSIASVPAGSRVVRYFGNDKEFVISTTGSGSALRYSVNRPKPGADFQKPSGAAADANQAALGVTGTVTGSNSGNGGNWVAQTIVLREAPVVVIPTVSINDVTANEGNSGETDLSFTVTLSSASASAVTVDFATANGTTNPATGGSAPCTAGTDYQTRTGTITFPIGSTSQTVVIKACGDLVNELNETFFVNLNNPSASATIADNQGLGTITNDDAAPSISIGDVTQAEGSPNFAFTASLSVASSQTVTASFATANGTSNPATGGASCGAGVDYVTQTGGTVTFNPGETSKSVTVAVCDDALDEVNETFEVNLSSPTNATIGDGQGLGTITDDDASPSLSIDDVTQAEGTGGTTNFTFTVTLSAASGQGSTVNFSTANGSSNPATGGASCGAAVDYVTQTGGVVGFNPGETSKSVTVAVCSDALDEANETFVVDLSAPANATISDSQGLGTITDDDASPSLSIDNVTQAEGTGGTTNFTFDVTLSGASAQTVAVDFATAAGTTNPATAGACPGAGVDFVTTSGTRTFTPGDVSESITVAVCADAVDEANETFFVNLSNESNATISDGQGLGTITDDDAAPSLSINGVTQSEGTGGTTNFTFTVTLSAASAQTVAVDFATAAGTTNPATAGACGGAGVDFVTTSGTRTFTPGDVSESITVAVCADALDEANETFFVNLSNESNATISDGQGLGTITDDDAAPSLSINDVTSAEGTGGTTNFTFTASLSAASGQTVTVDFATANGTTNPATGGAACPGADYVTQNGTRTFVPGDQSETITVVVCADALDESDETFLVNLSNEANATTTDAQGVGTITDDDLPADQLGPVTSNVVANPNPVMMNTSFELSAKVDDSNTGNSNIASAEYSLDGGTWVSAGAAATPAFNTSPIVNVKWTVPGQPTGVYSVCVRGTDAANNTGVASCILVAVYDPSAGFVTGGGWIDSPLGAYVANPALTGRANFGFVSKYKKGANVPDGSTEFQFQAAGLNFHSTIYEWLVVAGQRAQFKGLGRLNGIDGHGFMLTAINGTPDKFRIKITNPAGAVVYDNQLNQPDEGNAATNLGGGNIVIHKP